MQTNRGVLIILFSITTLFAIIFMDTNQDIWFMLNNGKYLVENGTFPTKEFITIHNDYTVLIEKWITCVLFYSIYSVFGMIGLEIFKIVLIWCIIGLIYYIMRKRTEYYFIPVLFIITACIPSLIQKRPTLLSLILLLVEYILLEKYTETKNIKILLWFPVLAVIMMNVHSTYYIWYFIIAFPYLFQNLLYNEINRSVIKQELKYSLYLLISGIISFIALGLNPYGYTSVINTLKQMRIPELGKYVNELQLPTMGGSVIALLCLCAIIVFSICLYLNRKKMPIRDIILPIIIFIIFIRAGVRNYIYFIIFTSLVMVKYFDIKVYKKLVPISISVILLIFSSASALKSYTVHNEIQDTIESNVPKGTTVFANPDLGSWLGFNGYKTYMDTRFEIYSDVINEVENTFTEYIKATPKELQDRYNFDYYILLKQNKLRTLIDLTTDFEKIFEDEEKELYIYRVDK